MKGLLVFVLRPAGGGSQNGGVTATHDQFILTWDRALAEPAPVFEPDEQTPELRLQTRCGRLIAIPVGDPRLHDGTHRGPMFGGCYITSSDSRFPGEYPIPVHDRFEA